MDSQRDDSSQDGPESKMYKLHGGEMEVISARKKKSTDQYITLELKFILVGDSRPRIVGELFYDPMPDTNYLLSVLLNKNPPSTLSNQPGWMMQLLKTISSQFRGSKVINYVQRQLALYL